MSRRRTRVCEMWGNTLYEVDLLPHFLAGVWAFSATPPMGSGALRASAFVGQLYSALLSRVCCGFQARACLSQPFAVCMCREKSDESAPDKKRGGSAGAMKAKSNNRGESYRMNLSPCRAACLAPLVDHFADGPLSLCVSRADGRRGHRRSHLREDVLPLVVLVHRPRDCVLLIEHRAGHLIEPTRQ